MIKIEDHVFQQVKRYNLDKILIETKKIDLSYLNFEEYIFPPNGTSRN